MRITSRRTRLTGKKKIALVLVGAGIVAASGGVAFAYWSSTGTTGTGTAATGTQTNTLTVAQTNNPAGLAPGIAPTGVTGTIVNTAAGKSTFVNQVVVTVSAVTPANAGLTCTVGNYQLVLGASTTAVTSAGTAISTATPTVTLPINQDVAPGATVTLPAFSIGFVDYTAINQNGCQGATPTLTYTLS